MAVSPMDLLAQQEAQRQVQIATSGRTTDSGRTSYNQVAQNLSSQAQKNIEATNKISKEEIKSRIKIAQMQIGASSENTAAQVAVEREKIQQAYAQMQQIGVPQLQLDQWKAQKTAELQQSALELQKDQFAWEQNKDQQTLELEKAKWREQNALAIRKQNFDETSFSQNLQYERERDAASLGLDREKYLASRADADRTYDLQLQQFGFQSTMAVRDAALKERAQAAQEQQFGQTFGEGQRQFNVSEAERERQFNTNTALDVVKTGATMGGPGDWANFLDYSGGVQNTGTVPVFVQRLLGQSTAGGGAATGAAPPARTLAGVASSIAGTPPQQQAQAGQPQQPATIDNTGAPATSSAVPSQTDSANVAAGLVATNPPSARPGWNERDLAILGKIGQIYAAPQKVQDYSALSRDEKAFLAGGAAKAGYSQNTFEDQLARSRIGQGSVWA
jgi:hypothetical protein